MGFLGTWSVIIGDFSADLGEGGMRMSRKSGLKSSGMSGRVTIWLEEGEAMVVALVKMAVMLFKFINVVNTSLESR